MIDLHLHTTASDGHAPPETLVALAAAAGVRTLAVTDHDTLAAVPAVTAAARACGLEVVPGLEITAVHEGHDVHLLGYFVDPLDRDLATFLDAQRADRRRRIAVILQKLDRLGVRVEAGAIEARLGDTSGRAIGRPAVAAALVEAGHAASMADAFGRFLGRGRPAFVPRIGAPPAEVIAVIRRAGGCASLAHPGKLSIDHLIPGLVAAGLDAVEVYHPDHDKLAVGRYREIARRDGLLVTGGSDYHGPAGGRVDALGRVTLPEDDFANLTARAAPGWRSA